MTKTVVSLIAFLLFAGTVSAQTYPNSTTLSATISASDTVIPIASGTGVAANGALWIDSEFIPINVSAPCANTACTRVNVTRVAKPQPHGSGTVVTVVSAAARPNIMLASSAAWRVGVCSTSTSGSPSTALANYQFLPIFDIDTGWVYMCRRNGTSGAWVWNATNALAMNGTTPSVWTAWP